ncbi:hypothetical protein BJZ21_002275 [Nocardioides panaciterrulae]|uniref:Uncharacterized protein n=1 Tax=Nocardioides panaciterrulae TaxID=661492 RepID=A0A7Y9E717_9ACTN|nr:hypothetical protein [Nocardioides panaciterrulae]
MTTSDLPVGIDFGGIEGVRPGIEADWRAALRRTGPPVRARHVRARR